MSALPLVVVGAGPAGLAAADAASAQGAAVLLIDENGAAGGQIWRGGPAQWRDARADRLWRQLQARPGVELLTGARLVAQAADGALLLDAGGAARRVRWERLIVCTGARELLLPFPGWTLPGVTGAGGLQALIKGGMPIAGKRVVVAGTGPLLLAVAATVRRQGGQVVALAEQRGSGALLRFGASLAARHPGKLAQAAGLLAHLAGVPLLRGATVLAALGGERLTGVVMEQHGRQREIACDYLACGFGLLPSLEVAVMLSCATANGKVVVDGAQRTSASGVWAAGESTGIGGVDKSLVEGRLAGRDAVGMAASASDLAAVAKARRFADLLAARFSPSAQLTSLCTPSTIVCRCEDVRAAELVRHDGWRSAKLQTRVGMGPCQGRVCGSACAFLYGWETPGMRQPVFPVSAALLAAETPPA